MQALEREKNEAAAKTKVLERQVTELARLIALASEKVEEILKIGANDEISQPPAVNMPEESKGQMQLGEFSADHRENRKVAPTSLGVLTSAEMSAKKCQVM